MIATLKGTADIFGLNCVVVDVGGVGYKVFVNSKVIERIRTQPELLIYIRTYVKEDTLDLYGFLEKDELFLFELLLEVSGIGPKTALSVLERGEKEIREAIVSSDVAFFTAIPRIGTKNAQRIIIDLKSKLGSLSELDLTGKTQGVTAEVVEALTQMGFSRTEAVEAVRKLPSDLVTAEERVKEALKIIGKR